MLELLKDYDLSVFYHPRKANKVADGLSHLSVGSVSHIDEDKKDLVNDVQSFSRLGVILEDSLNGHFMVHHNSECSLVVKVKSKKHLDQPLIEVKESVLGKLNESFSLGAGGWCLKVSRKVVCSQCRWLEEPDS